MSGDELAAMVNEAGGGYEQTGEYLERLAERAREQTGEDWHVEHFPMEVPPDAVAHELEPWPDGTPCIVYTHWTGG